MTNVSGLKPLGVAVLLEPYTPERKGGVIELPQDVAARSTMVDNRAVVVEVGQSAWHDEPMPRAKAGDKVLVTKFAGFMAKGMDGKDYRLVNDRDIFCAITSEGEPNV
jgi:co-chaperonin GroES (HSP10)